MTRRSLFLTVTAFILAIASCKQASFYGTLGDKISTQALVIAPSTASLILGSSITFTATGGSSPYTFTVASGAGTINGSTGAFTASSLGNVVIRVTDKSQKHSDASVTVTPTGALSLNPGAVTVGTNSSIQFVAAGGTPPYLFSLGTTTSSPTFNPATGLYTSGFTSGGNDQVKVTDAASTSVTATVTVTPASSNVDYTISSGSYPAAGIGGKGLSGADTFTIRNGGGGAGTQSVKWWVYLSDSTTLNAAGTIMLANGTTGALAAGATVTIPITGTWPVVPVPAGATKYIFVMVQADDDLNSTNNVTAANAVVLTPPSVNYTQSGLSSTGAQVAGAPLSGTFTLQNLGTDAGVQSVSWTAYVSTDSTATIDAGAKVIDSGTTAALGASPASIAITFSGTWLVVPGGPYYLKVATSSPEDINTANNISVSGAYTTTFVDYTVSAVASTGGTVAGAGLNGQFTLQNMGNGAGSQPVSWKVYASTNTALDAGDALVSSGSNAALASGGSTVIGFGGTWPSAPGTYYLIVSVSSADDSVPGNNNVVSASTTTITAPAVDNTVVAVSNTGGTILPAGLVNGSFQFHNNGPDNGTQSVTWTAYASTSNVLDASAFQIASGIQGPLAGLATSAVIPFSGVWPLHYGSYYLIVSVSAPEDSNSGNNSGATATATTIGVFNEVPTEPNDDYTNLTNYFDLGVTLKPGMTLLVTGTLNASAVPPDIDDVLRFKTGTAASISLYMSWTGNHVVELFFLKGPPAVFFPGIQGPNTTSVSFGWIVDTPGAQRYIDVVNYTPSDVGNYQLIITAN